MLKEALMERTVENFVKLRSDEIEHMVVNVKMDMSIKDCKTRVWQLVIDYENALSAEGYQGVLERCPQTAIKHIRERTRPFVLQEKMVKVLQIEKKQGRHFNHFYDFVRRLVQEAKTVEMEGYEEPVLNDCVKEGSQLLESNNGALPDSGKPEGGATVAVPCDVQATGTNKVQTPFCWNKDKCFGQRHRLKQCPNTSAMEKKRIFHRAMRRKYGRNAKKVKAKIDNVRIVNIDKHSIMFKVSFADVLVDAVQGSKQLQQVVGGKQFDLRNMIEALRMGKGEMRDE
ncbi:hypothetical protein FGB62_126g014 [Gracilaria domingensis]|nr:hypothetical protein FGB62_126g014 [Gracilaria domingensis]